MTDYWLYLAISIFMQCIVILALAPLLHGFIKKMKALMQNRMGPSVFQPYYDLAKYFNKDAVLSEHSSWLTQVTPYIVFICALTAGMLVPVFAVSAALAPRADIIVFVYIFGVARFFMALAALDSGGSFGGMGSSREMALGVIIEPALLLVLFAVCLSCGVSNIGEISFIMARQELLHEPALLLALFAMVIVAIAETGRIPVDNPDTHLELTMIHEGMLLEYSGRYLGLMVWASHIKQLIILTLLIDLFFPWGLVITGGWMPMLLSVLTYILKLAVLGVLMAVVETLNAKLRFFLVPKLLYSSIFFSSLAIVILVLE